MDTRRDHMNYFMKGMADIVMSRTMLSREAEVILNDVVLDHYKDAQVAEVCRVVKNVMVRKNVDMSYIQEQFDLPWNPDGPELLQDNVDQLPFIVIMTITNLPRVIRKDDEIMIDGIKFAVSKVKPTNRDLPSIINVLVYPERTNPVDNKAYDSVFKPQ